MVFHHLASAGLPSLWVPFAYVDVVFLLLFLQAFLATGTRRAAS